MISEAQSQGVNATDITMPKASGNRHSLEANTTQPPKHYRTLTSAFLLVLW